jgi:hypothetical protein
MRGRRFQGRNLQQYAAGNVDETQFTRSLERADGLADPRATDEVGEEMFHFFLLGCQNTIEIFRDQRRQRLCHRDVHAFFNRLG